MKTDLPVAGRQLSKQVCPSLSLPKSITCSPILLSMGKARRNREKRKTATVTVRPVTPQDLRAVFGTSWPTMLDSDDLTSFAYPPEELMDTTACPVAQACAGCGARTELHVNTTAFSRPDGWQIGCATLCADCDGKSFLTLLGGDGLEEAFGRHQQHARH